MNHEWPEFAAGKLFRGARGTLGHGLQLRPRNDPLGGQRVFGARDTDGKRLAGNSLEVERLSLSREVCARADGGQNHEPLPRESQRVDAYVSVSSISGQTSSQQFGKIIGAVPEAMLWWDAF